MVAPLPWTSLDSMPKALAPCAPIPKLCFCLTLFDVLTAPLPVRDPVLVSAAAGAAAGEDAGEELPESGSSPGWSPLVGVALRAGSGEFGDEILSAL